LQDLAKHQKLVSTCSGADTQAHIEETKRLGGVVGGRKHVARSCCAAAVASCSRRPVVSCWTGEGLRDDGPPARSQQGTRSRTLLMGNPRSGPGDLQQRGTIFCVVVYVRVHWSLAMLLMAQSLELNVLQTNPQGVLFYIHHTFFLCCGIIIHRLCC
jgi:hypothetical protein